jgi:hypothetical protein
MQDELDKNKRPPPDRWADLSVEDRQELMEIAESRRTAKRVRKWFWDRVKRAQGLGTVILTMAAVFSLFGEQVEAWIKAWFIGKD